MKIKIANNCFAGMLSALFLIVSATVVNAQILINEVVLDAPSNLTEACNFVELRGIPNSIIPVNTKFLSIDGDAGNFGFISAPVELGGLQIGSNGTITLINDVELCAGRVYPAGTTQVFYTSFIGIGQGAETYAVVMSPTEFFEGDTIDANSDRVIDPAAQIMIIDGFGVTVNALFQATYAPNIFNAVVAGGGSTDLPDAVVRFRNVTTTSTFGLLGNAPQFYFSELANTPDNTTVFSGTPVSTNFPTGAALTPGEPNLPNAPTAATVSLGGRVTKASGEGISKVRVTLTDSTGETRQALTSSLGYYRFEEIPAGDTYLVDAKHRQFAFQSQFVQLNEERNDINFVTVELNKQGRR